MKKRINKYIEARKRQNRQFSLNAFTQMEYQLDPALLQQMKGGYAQGQQEQTPMMQNGGIMKHQSKGELVSGHYTDRRFSKNNPELYEYYEAIRNAQSEDWNRKYAQHHYFDFGEYNNPDEYYTQVPALDIIEKSKSRKDAKELYSKYMNGIYDYDSANDVNPKFKKIYRQQQRKIENDTWKTAADMLANKVDGYATGVASRKDYEGLGYFGLGASLMPAILAAGYSLPAILNTGGTALGFLGSPLTTTVQSATNLVPSLAQYSWLQPSLFAGGIGTALTSCSSPEVRKKEEEKEKWEKEKVNDNQTNATDIEKEILYQLTKYPNNNWTDSLITYYVDGFNKADLGWEPRGRAQIIADESSYNKYAKNGSYVGPFQMNEDIFQRLYGTLNGTKAYNEYLNSTRSDRKIATDMLKYDSLRRINIATDEDNLGYGRQKLQQYAPNKTLNDTVSNKVWDNNVIYEIKSGVLDTTLKKKNSTYRDLMNNYDNIFYK